VGARPVPVAEGVVAQEVAVLEELERSWAPIRDFLRRLLREGASPLLAEEVLAFPGLEELVALRAIREVEAMGEFDVCVADCAPTGGTLRMLRFPDALRAFMGSFFEIERRGVRLVRPLLERLRAGDVVPGEDLFDAVERLYEEVDSVRALLLDGRRTTARLVVNPARVVVEEARRSFAYLSLYGVATDAVVVNRVLPAEAAGGWFARWAARERGELEAIEASFPIPRLLVPLEPTELRGLPALEGLAETLYARRDPAQRFTEARPIRLVKRLGRPRLEIDLPGARKEELEVRARGGELVIRLRDATRLVALPASVAGRKVARARLEDGVLAVDFA
jgi:arsenite-transporting ATPase